MEERKTKFAKRPTCFARRWTSLKHLVCVREANCPQPALVERVQATGVPLGRGGHPPGTTTASRLQLGIAGDAAGLGNRRRSSRAARSAPPPDTTLDAQRREERSLLASARPVLLLTAPSSQLPSGSVVARSSSAFCSDHSMVVVGRAAAAALQTVRDRRAADKANKTTRRSAALLSKQAFFRPASLLPTCGRGRRAYAKRFCVLIDEPEWGHCGPSERSILRVGEYEAGDDKARNSWPERDMIALKEAGFEGRVGQSEEEREEGSETDLNDFPK